MGLKVFTPPSVPLVGDRNLPAGGSLTHSQALALSKRARDVTALRCSEPLRSKVGGPKRSSPCCAGWDRLGIAGGKGNKPDMLLKPYNKYRAVSYELDAYERKNALSYSPKSSLS